MNSIPNSPLLERYNEIRRSTEEICAPLEIEDYVLQPMADVSPPKWHLGHTTWFFETFILERYCEDFQLYDPDFSFIYNSYYESIGARVIRVDRGNLSRPTVSQVYKYRHYIDEKINQFLLNTVLDEKMKDVFILGLNHEQQHQELLLCDIKFILGNNPLFPIYETRPIVIQAKKQDKDIIITEGIYEIGTDQTEEFSFDNERTRHKVYLQEYSISDKLITNKEYLEFMEDSGYANFIYWHADGWEWVKKNHIACPLYWHKVNGEWFNYTLNGFQRIDLDAPVCHVSYYEAAAFANWKGTRLPTEAEWEVASEHFWWGQRWEWTESAYLPYPGFKKEKGAIGEYNGKFMVSQQVLRGASEATPKEHSRRTYRNFFYPHQRWQFTGIRIIK